MTPDYTDEIMGDDREDPALRSVLTLMNRYDPDHPHAIQVGRLSLRLFGDLVPLHNLGLPDRRLLLFAALLHDTGWSIPGDPHHKASMNLILTDQTILVNPDERKIVALIARYHRKAHPSPTHRIFSSISTDQKYLVLWGAALLRIADALDRSHDSRVSLVSARISDEIITLLVDTDGKGEISGSEDTGFQKKAALLGEVSGRKIEVIWE